MMGIYPCIPVILKVKASRKFFKLKMWMVVGPQNSLTESLKGAFTGLFMYPELGAKEEYWQDISQESKQQKLNWQT